MTFLSKIAQIYPEIYASGDAESLHIYAHTHVNVCENIKQDHIDKSNECILAIFYMVTHQLVHYLARFTGLLTEVKKCFPKLWACPPGSKMNLHVHNNGSANAICVHCVAGRPHFPKYALITLSAISKLIITTIASV